MLQGNHTVVTEFFMIGFRNVQAFKIPLFILFLFIYLASILENMLIVALVYCSIRLHSPMYFILCMLSIGYIVHITNLVPRMLYDIIAERPTIPVLACIAQLNILASEGMTICSLYALMSYDRYLAIANPLRYSALLHIRLCLWIALGFWLCCFSYASIVAFFLSRLDFCSSDTIDYFYCDIEPLAELSCSSVTLVKGIALLMGAAAVIFPLLFNIFAYIFIIYIILKIPSVSGRKKAFSTCSSHLIVFNLNYWTLIIITLFPAKNFPSLNKGLSLIHIAMVPLLNPIIYTLRNQEFHKALNVKVIQVKRFFSS